MSRPFGTYYCRFCFAQRPRGRPACDKCVADGRIDATASAAAPRSSVRPAKHKLTLPPGFSAPRCPSGCGRAVAPRWRDKPCFTCFKKANPERAKVLEDRVAAKRAAMVDALRPNLELRKAEAAEMTKRAHEAFKARVAFLSGECWTEAGMVVEGRTSQQCCYDDCRAAHRGNGFCSGHQPPADRLKAAVTAAKVVLERRATQAPRLDTGLPR